MDRSESVDAGFPRREFYGHGRTEHRVEGRGQPHRSARHGLGLLPPCLPTAWNTVRTGAGRMQGCRAGECRNHNGAHHVAPPSGWFPRVTPRTRNVVCGCVSVSMQADSATSPTAPTVKNTLRRASLSWHGKENGLVPASVCVPSLAKGQNADGATARISHSHHSSETSPSTWRAFSKCLEFLVGWGENYMS